MVKLFKKLGGKLAVSVLNLLPVSAPQKALIASIEEKEPTPKKIVLDSVTVLDDDKALFLSEYNLNEPGLNKLIIKGYELLGLETFFTAGEKEVKAWTIRKGFSAPQAAGVIHTDFERGFIKAEVYTYDDLMEFKSELKIKENGKLRQEGKDYIVRDGDIIFFKFNV